MASRWLEALKKEESKHNTSAALRERQTQHSVRPAEKSKTPINSPSKTSNTPNRHDIEGENSQTRQSAPSKTINTPNGAKTPSEAEKLGLVSTWAAEFGYISIHDPTTGEWHDLRTEDAPGWAKREAFKRKELYRDGNRKAFRLTSREMEEIWKAERGPEPEGIVEDHPVEEEG